MNGKKILHRFYAVLLALAIALPLAGGVTFDAMAASASAKNKKALEAYEKLNATLLKNYDASWQKYVDLTGDGIKEYIVVRCKSGSMPESLLSVYTYKKGKASRILKYPCDPWHILGISYYKKTKSLVIKYHRPSLECYYYYKLSGGKYKYRGGKSYGWQGSDVYKWSYWNSSDKTVTKAKFNKLMKNVISGKKKSLGSPA